jgi:ubiquinone/menaquinone biosynthesis C-methylase UbiE
LDVPSDHFTQKGKNTEWLITKAKYITAIDLSEKMLEKAKLRIHSDNVQFIQTE